ncbi:MAG: AAA family ATPase [Pseudomonadota bacterium]
MKLKGTLNTKYKSFPQGFEFEIDGPMAILSGANGSGKSQLFDIMRRLKQRNENPEILLELTLDGADVASSQIAFRSFREGIQGFKNADPELVSASRTNIKHNYQKNRLSLKHRDLIGFQKSADHAKKILIEVFGEEKFNSGRITQEDIDNCDSLGDFIWKADDIFENVVSEVFYNYAVKKVQIERVAAKHGKTVSYEKLGAAPWTEFNDLFERFEFGYRFNSDYEIARNSFSLTEKPTLYPIKKNGSLLKDHPRDLVELSDGERAIMSLVISSLSGEFADTTKLILLDEFDATLNPSLINILFGVLDEHFIQKSIMVILVTHSSSTISMAPPTVNFYELFNPLLSPERILKINRDDYDELRLAHQKLYGSIRDQKNRIQTLSDENKRLQEILDGTGKPTILVEGPTDITYIQKAAEHHNKLSLLEKLDIKIVGEDSSKGTKGSNSNAMKAAGKFLKAHTSVLAHKVVILHDPEVEVEEESVDGVLFIRKMIPHSSSHLRGGIEKLFPMSVVERARIHNPSWFKAEQVGNNQPLITIIGNKSDVCQWICDNTYQNEFTLFTHIFNWFN